MRHKVKHVVRAGDKFSHWTVTSQPRQIRIKGHARLFCTAVCDCGTKRRVACGNLYGGHSKSCGCLNRRTHWKHGMSKSPEHRIYSDAKQRCTNPKNRAYQWYGARGIKFR